MRGSLRFPLIACVTTLTVANVAYASDPETQSTDVLDASVDEDPAIYGGTDVPTCGWPTTVSFGGCTGTLVHPQVVVYAAHCGPQGSVRFGESANGAARIVPTSMCRTNPSYNGGAQGQDHAFCILQTPQDDIPITPILMGCETTVLQPGKEVTIVGFGNADTGPFGIKREVTTTINQITNGNEAFIGGGGKDSCQGDSGGPVYVKLDASQGGDDTWRVFGITSYGGACGGGGYYSMMHIAMDWLEGELAQYNIDLTPCHTSDGTWQPTPECFGFPYTPNVPAGSWANGCAGGELSGYSSMCGAPFNNEPDEDPPTVSITNPADQTLYDSMGAGSVTITINVDANDGDGWGIQRVALLIDGTEVASDPAPPYEWANVNFPQGTYTLEALATDYAGNEAISAAVQIGVDEEPEPPLPPPTTGESDAGSGDDGTASGEVGTGSAGDETGDAGIGDEGGGEGCACDASGDDSAPVGALALFGLVAWRRRRS